MTGSRLKAIMLCVAGTVNNHPTVLSIEALIPGQGMISDWLREHRAEYNSATEAIKACLRSFKLHRRHRRMLWAIYSKTDFSHLKGR